MNVTKPWLTITNQQDGTIRVEMPRGPMTLEPAAAEQWAKGLMDAAEMAKKSMYHPKQELTLDLR